ncbi:MAG: basic helix-loop-helix protein [Alyxoria varia]|nr:MAG: basic helix-loop-helix protein [Alyxoria varia]
MAATTSYNEQQHFPESEPKSTPIRSSKRKRGGADLDTSTPTRGPNPRRSTSHQFASQQEAATTANMQNLDGNEANAFAHQGNGDDSNQGFDLSALQQAQATPSSQQGDNTHHGQDESMNNTAAAALTQYSMTVPPHPAQTFMNEPTANSAAAAAAGAYDGSAPMDNPNDNNVPAEFQTLDTAPRDDVGGSPTTAAGAPATPGGSKPAVGSNEWVKQRKDNHKEVERRRRETINEGINELAKIVPGCEKNKGSILARAVQYIQKLQEDASQNIDKWTFEKLVTEQAIGDLSSKLQRAWQEKEAWKRVAREAGVEVDKVDLGIGGTGDESESASGPGNSMGENVARSLQAQMEEHTRNVEGVRGHHQQQHQRHADDGANQENVRSVEVQKD